MTGELVADSEGDARDGVRDGVGLPDWPGADGAAPVEGEAVAVPTAPNEVLRDVFFVKDFVRDLDLATVAEPEGEYRG